MNSDPEADTVDAVAFRDVPPGRVCKTSNGRYIKIDPACEFAQQLDRPLSYAVALGSGEITFIGPDTLCEYGEDQ